MNNLTTKITPIMIAIFAEIFLIFLIYLNPYKIEPLYDPGLQMWVSAFFNALSAVFLTTAVFKIKNKKKKQHIVFIHLALIASALFLVNYIFYHMSVGHVVFKNESIRPIYLIILFSHLLVSLISLPAIFYTYTMGITKNYLEHKRWALRTFIMWEYVSITGVIVVLMLKFCNQ